MEKLQVAENINWELIQVDLLEQEKERLAKSQKIDLQQQLVKKAEKNLVKQRIERTYEKFFETIATQPPLKAQQTFKARRKHVYAECLDLAAQSLTRPEMKTLEKKVQSMFEEAWIDIQSRIRAEADEFRRAEAKHEAAKHTRALQREQIEARQQKKIMKLQEEQEMMQINQRQKLELDRKVYRQRAERQAAEALYKQQLRDEIERRDEVREAGKRRPQPRRRVPNEPVRPPWWVDDLSGMDEIHYLQLRPEISTYSVPTAHRRKRIQWYD